MSIKRLIQLVIWPFVQKFVLVYNKEMSKLFWPFVGEIHRWPVDSPHKGSVMWKESRVSIIMQHKLSHAHHYSDVIMSAMASQITRVSMVYSSVGSSADQRKYQSSSSLAFVWGNHWWPVDSPHKGPVTRKMFPFDDIVMYSVIIFSIMRECWVRLTH